MKLSKAFTIFVLSIIDGGFFCATAQESNMVKMCLFYPNPSGHARSDPILNQTCPSDHVHTFYGPQEFHPKTSYVDLRNTKPQFSSSAWVENQSLYWHPSIYEVREVENQPKTYKRVSNLETSPYYRWDTTTTPETVEFPPGFRMIAYSDQTGANENVGDIGGDLLVECCQLNGEEEDCEETFGKELIFPDTNCDFVGIAFAMPTCWDDTRGIGEVDPFSHVAYTTDGTVSGPCPTGFNKRLPQIQLFLRIINYRGAEMKYQLADGNNVFHVDFMNGWKEGKLKQILDKCVPSGEPGYNPPCDCDQFLTENKNPAPAVCDSDVKQYILDEETEEVSSLPRGTCQGTDLIGKSWNIGQAPPFTACRSEPQDDCVDSMLTFEINDVEDGFLGDCNWAAEDPDLRCDNVGVEEHCPVTCDADEFCFENTRNKFALAETGRLRTCRWVARERNKRCKKLDMCNTCRDTCADFERCNYLEE